MKFRKCFKHAFEMVLHSKLRSWLTILGIVIGVASVISIMSIGAGLQQTINTQLGSLGGDILTLTAGFSRGSNFFGGPGGGGEGGGGTSASTTTPVLTKADVQILKGIPEVSLIDTNIRGSVSVSYLGKTGKVTVTGVDQKVWSQITTLTISDGRMLDSADQNVVVVGGRLAASYFTQPLGINKMITIGGNSFRIVGILSDQSNSIYMPIQMAYQIIPEKTNGVYDSITIKVKDESQLDATINKTQEKLMNSRHVTARTKDFTISSSKEMQQTRAQAMSSISAFLVALASVSLIVGAVGIANTMFTSVLEKTKEIGIMKAIGARNHDIMLIFLLNSTLIGLVGGLIGTLFGIILSAFLPALMGSGTLPLGRGASTTFVSLHSVILALSVAVIVGVVAGIIPAYQASKLKPVDALRYE
jgi:putative ABC transport system permease protein